MRPLTPEQVAVLVAIARTVTATSPQIPPSLAVWTAATSAVTKRLRTLLMHELHAHPDALVSGASSASLPAQRIVRDLTSRGIEGLAQPRCARCGKARMLAHPLDDGSRICGSCWKAVTVRQCTTCGQVRHGYRMRDGQAFCRSCFRKDPANRRSCSGCGRLAWVAKKGPDGPLCEACWRPQVLPCARCHRVRVAGVINGGEPLCRACYHSLRSHPRTCPSCGVWRMAPYRRDGLDVCAGCAGEQDYVRCRNCGTDTRTLWGQLCTECLLPRYVRKLISDPSGRPHPQLLPVEKYLLASPTNAQSRLDWMQRGAGSRIIRRMAAGEMPVSLRAVAELRRSSATEYIAALLIESGAVPQEDFVRVRFEVWLQSTLQAISNVRDRAAAQQYAAWVVKPRFARAAENTNPFQRGAHARVELVEIRRFLRSLADAGVSLTDAPQRLYDEYAATRGKPARELIRFVNWARAGGLTRLRGQYTDEALRGPTVSDDQRWEWVRTLLTAEDIVLNSRVAGLLATVFGISMSRVVTLRRSAVTVDGDQVSVTFGSEPLTLPTSLAGLMRRLLQVPPQSPVSDDVWVFRGKRPGAHLSDRSVASVLTPLGIGIGQGRMVAIMTLSRDIQPPIVADLVGVAVETAARWSAHAGGDWAPYPQLRAAVTGS